MTIKLGDVYTSGINGGAGIPQLFQIVEIVDADATRFGKPNALVKVARWAANSNGSAWGYKVEITTVWFSYVTSGNRKVGNVNVKTKAITVDMLD